MQESKNSLIHEKYRDIYLFFMELQNKLLRLDSIKGELSKEKFESLTNEYSKKKSQTESKLSSLANDIDLQIKETERHIIQLKTDREKMERQLLDLKLLSENKILDEIQQIKETKILEKKRSEIGRQLIAKEDIVRQMKLILAYPDPEDEAKALFEKQQREKVEKTRQEKADKKAGELKEKRKMDIQYQIQKVKKELQIQSERMLNDIQKNANKKMVQLQEQINRLQMKKNEIQKNNNKLSDLLKICQLKSEKYKQKIETLNTEFEEKKYPCGDGNCSGFIGFDGLCKKCGKNFREAVEYYKKTNQINELEKRIRRINNTSKISVAMITIIGLLIFLLLSTYATIILTFIIVIAIIIFGQLKVSANRVEILNIQEYGLSDDNLNLKLSFSKISSTQTD